MVSDATGPQVVAVGTAVGEPFEKRIPASGSAVSTAASSGTAVAGIVTGFVYTPLLAKVFHDMDVNSDGLVDEDELTSALARLDVGSASVASFDKNADVSAVPPSPACRTLLPRTSAANAGRAANS